MKAPSSSARPSFLPRRSLKRLGVLGTLGSTGTFRTTVTIISFMPDSWDIIADGFPR